METLTIDADLPVFGSRVHTFPEGVGQAFDDLVTRIPDGLQRAYYGISYMDNGRIVYIAAAEEKSSDEAKKYGVERYVIGKGKYLMVAIKDWQTKIPMIKDVFEKMMQDSRVDLSKPCLEWYKSDEEMLCMMKMLPKSS